MEKDFQSALHDLEKSATLEPNTTMGFLDSYGMPSQEDLGDELAPFYSMRSKIYTVLGETQKASADAQRYDELTSKKRE